MPEGWLSHNHLRRRCRYVRAWPIWTRRWPRDVAIEVRPPGDALGLRCNQRRHVRCRHQCKSKYRSVPMTALSLAYYTGTGHGRLKTKGMRLRLLQANLWSRLHGPFRLRSSLLFLRSRLQARPDLRGLLDPFSSELAHTVSAKSNQQINAW
jgi:hypothetical protein